MDTSLDCWGPGVYTGDRRTKMPTSLRRAGAWSLEKGRTRRHRSQGSWEMAKQWAGGFLFWSGSSMCGLLALLSLLSASQADLSLIWSEDHILWGQLPPGSESCPVWWAWLCKTSLGLLLEVRGGEGRMAAPSCEKGIPDSQCGKEAHEKKTNEWEVSQSLSRGGSSDSSRPCTEQRAFTNKTALMFNLKLLFFHEVNPLQHDLHIVFLPSSVPVSLSLSHCPLHLSHLKFICGTLRKNLHVKL